MIDTKRKGIRCRAKKLIRDHGVTIEPDNRGTIVYEIEDLGATTDSSRMGWRSSDRLDFRDI